MFGVKWDLWLNGAFLELVHFHVMDHIKRLSIDFVSVVSWLLLESAPGPGCESRHDTSNNSWLLNYTVLTFLMNGYLYAEYRALQGMLELPSCLDSQWQRIVGKLEEKVTELAEWFRERKWRNLEMTQTVDRLVWHFIPDTGPLLKQLLCHSPRQLQNRQGCKVILVMLYQLTFVKTSVLSHVLI